MTTSADRIALDVYVNWWGLLRRPPLYADQPIGRSEACALGLCVGVGLSLAWTFFLLVIAPLAALAGPSPGVAAGIAVMLSVVLPAAALAVPPERWEGTTVGEAIVGMREKGGLASFDRLVLAAAAAGTVGVAFRTGSHAAQSIPSRFSLPAILPPAEAAVLALGVVAAAAATAVLWQKAAPFLPRGRSVPPPGWWRPAAGAGMEPAMPEESSSFAYPFPEQGVAAGVVGIRIGEGVLEQLRRLNAEHEGRLFVHGGRDSAVTVALGSGAPVLGTGTEELKRLAVQFLALANRNGWTSYQLACRILRFVQRSVSYVHDDESTARILGTSYSEYGRFPLETLFDGEGDCDCSALLCASLLAYVGIPSALLFVRLRASAFEPESHHVAIGLELSGSIWPGGEAAQDGLGELRWKGRAYLYGETAIDTLDPPSFGGVPETWRGRLELEAVVDVPVYR